MDGMDATKSSTLKETDRKCPKCAGVMDYDPETGGTACPYCGYTEDIKVEDNDKGAQELDFASAEKKGNCDWGAKKKQIICKSCGAETIYDALEVANECPYCGSNQVMEAQDEDTLAPNGVVPFKVTKDQASDNFKRWIGKKFFCPKLAKQSARPDSFKGIYLPYWTFDSNTHSSYTAKYGKDRRVKKGDQETTVTDWYNTSGFYNDSFDDVLVIATNRHNTGMLRGIEPFNTADNKTYKPEYVAGFLAERYSIGLDDGWKTAKNRIDSNLRNSIENKIRSQTQADHVKDLSVKTSYRDITYKYLMLPIWCSSFKYNSKVYQFVVNGQTGKVYGKTPVSAIKVILVILVVLIVLAILYFVFMNS